MFQAFKKSKYTALVRRWLHEELGLAAVEAALIFPLLLTLLLGVYDTGNAILANQKTIRASQVAADLVTRSRTIDETGLDEAVEAARLAFSPFDGTAFGIDIVSVRFNGSATAEIVWRDTRNMSPLDDVLARVSDLAEANSGVIVVTVQYLFEPAFGDFVIDNIPMQEIAFARGRNSPVVNLE